MYGWLWATLLPRGLFRLDAELGIKLLFCSAAQRLKRPRSVVLSVPASVCAWEAELTSVEGGRGVSNGKSGTSQWVQGVTFNARVQVKTLFIYSCKHATILP